MKVSQDIQNMFVCPYSLGRLKFEKDKAISETSGDEYPIIDGRIDLRLKRPKKISADFTLGEGLNLNEFSFGYLGENTQKEVDFEGVKVPYHLTKEMLSYIPRAKNDNSYVLDLGCGTGLHRGVCERAGYKYIGMDYASHQASFLGDGHALPFADQSIDFVISIAVLEHVQYPWIMAREVRRVLKPGGRFIATVSFLEPFHEVSYYHVTHAGLLNNLRIAGWEDIKAIAPQRNWEGFEALSIMHYFSSLPLRLIKAFIYPYYLLHRLWWKFAQLSNRRQYHPFTENYRILAAAGSFVFIADK